MTDLADYIDDCRERYKGDLLISVALTDEQWQQIIAALRQSSDKVLSGMDRPLGCSFFGTCAFPNCECPVKPAAEAVRLWKGEVAAMVKRLRTVAEMREPRIAHIIKIAAEAAALIEKLGQGWISVSERLPEYGVMVLVTDGRHFAAGSRSFEIEKPTKMRGYEADGTIGPRFTEYVPNPDAGKRHEYFFPHGCSAFDDDTNVYDYDGLIYFEPTHWMPLPPPPERP